MLITIYPSHSPSTLSGALNLEMNGFTICADASGQKPFNAQNVVSYLVDCISECMVAGLEDHTPPIK